MMFGNCYVSSTISLQEVLAQTPPGKRALFRVITIPPNIHSGYIGSVVYVRHNQAICTVAELPIKGLQAENLMFMYYETP